MVELQGPSVVRGVVTDQLDGTYDASYSVTRAGRYTLNVASVHQGGLVAEYFENIWLFYAPVVRRVEQTVDRQWQLATETITNSASQYVSVRWSGYLRPPYSETLTFFVEADAGTEARLVLDGLPLIDCWSETMERGGGSGAKGQCLSGQTLSVNGGLYVRMCLCVCVCVCVFVYVRASLCVQPKHATMDTRMCTHACHSMRAHGYVHVQESSIQCGWSTGAWMTQPQFMSQRLQRQRTRDSSGAATRCSPPTSFPSIICSMPRRSLASLCTAQEA